MEYILKSRPEDFLVEEITPEGTVLELGKPHAYAGDLGKFLHAVLEKKGIDTIRATREIARSLGIRPERITYAGVKDKQAVAAQRISLYKVEKEDLEKISLPGIKLAPTGRGDKIALGMLFGNRFTITIRGLSGEPEGLRKNIESRAKKMNSYFPNYFGEQRFGTKRPISALVGKLILQRNFREAAETYISKTFPGEPEGIKKVRRLAQKDMKTALSKFPNKYLYERILLKHLLDAPKDYIGAIRRLPLGLQKMFIHAYQSMIFNKVLAMIEKGGISGTALEIPLVGSDYSSRIFETPADKYVKKVLAKEKISPKDFAIKEIPEISSAGNSRKAFEKFTDFGVPEVLPDEIFSGKEKAVVRFTLPKGCYATVFLEKLFSDED